jgi:hypothetical protein
MADGDNQLSAAGPAQSGVNMTPSSSVSGANAVSGGNAVSNTSSAQGENQRDTYLQEIISQLQQQQSATANQNPGTGSSFVSDNLSWQDPQVYFSQIIMTLSTLSACQATCQLKKNCCPILRLAS